MSTNGYFFNDYNIPDALQEIRETISNSKGYMALEEIQRHIDEIYPPALRELSEKIQPYLDEWATATKLQDEIALYSPIFDELKRYEDFYDNAFASIAQNQAAMELMADIDSYATRDIFYSFRESEKISQEINIDTASALYAEGKITDEDIVEEVGEMVSKKDFSFSDTWDNIKKSKWFLAVRFILIRALVLILTLPFSPLDERIKNDYLEKLKANEFWEESGAYEMVDKIFGIKSGAVSEHEAKETVSEENVGNISKKKREDLLQKIQAIRDYISSAPQDENTGNLLAYLSELEKDVNGKKYGLVFEEHREEIDEVLDTHTPVLTEEKGLFIDNGGQMNFLIEGDNLAALKLLEKTHRGKIDLIYIDPPYNTGKKSDDPSSGFMYDDAIVDDKDTFIHSKWLSFMNQRLLIADKLLSINGVLFISIDDHELSSIKALLDEIFGEKNFIAILPRVTKKSGKDHTDDIARNHDYVVAFAKNKASSPLCGICAESDDYPEKDEFFELRGGYKLNQTLDYDSLWYNEAMDFPLSVDGKVYLPGGNETAYEERHKGNHKPKDWVWRWSKEKFEFGLQNGFIVIKKGRGRPRIYTKTYSNASISKTRPYTIEYKERETHLSSIALVDNIYSNDNAKKEITKIGLESFGFPKPSSLIERLLTVTKKTDTVLDFFAGSGTTGHAVMKLNAEDGGNRRFILCTNNENNICRDVTYERIKRVIDKESYAASLKYYRVDYVPIDERMYYEYADELLKHIRELVELENGVNFIGNAEISIVLTEEELEAFVSNADAFSKCKKLYMGHDLLPTQEQEKALEERGIEISIIPDYYYRDLQER